MKIKIIGLIICLALTVLCFAGCKDDTVTSSEPSATTPTQSGSVDANSNDEITESQLDEIIEEWESNTPQLEIEGGSSDKTDDTTTSSTNSDTASSSSNDTQSGDGTEDTDSSSDTEDTESEDDGYFNVAV